MRYQTALIGEKLVVGLTPLTSFDSIKGKSAELPTVKLEPNIRFKRITYALQVRCSIVELIGQTI